MMCRVYHIDDFRLFLFVCCFVFDSVVTALVLIFALISVLNVVLVFVLVDDVGVVFFRQGG